MSGIQNVASLPFDPVLARLPVMLPCNAVVYEGGEGTVVVAIDPMETVAASSAALRPIADEVRGKLARVLERVP